MTELLLALAGALGLGGLSGLWLTRRAQRAHIIDTRTAWVRAGQRVRFGPVGVVCFAHPPQTTYTRGLFGALGITEGQLVFEGHRDHRADLRLPLTHIQRIGLCRVAVRAGRTASHKRALSIHHQDPDGWRVTTIISDDPQDIAAALSDICDLPVHDSGTARDDYGPTDTTRMTQDVYGDWFPDREGVLYLAPDRLLFNWRDAIALDTIERIDVLARGTWRDRLPLAESLLRIEHGAPDGARDVTGFVLRRADDWAGAIQQRIRNPITIRAGRKKKAL